MVDAPGEPGQPPRWRLRGKNGVGRSLRDDARIWFTLGDGILNEIAYPRIEQTVVRDFGLIVTDGADLFAEERRHCVHTIAQAEPGVPVYSLTATHRPGADADGTVSGEEPPPDAGARFRLHKRIFADPVRPAILQHVRLEDLRPEAAEQAPLRVHALLAPHLSTTSDGTGTAWVGEFKGVPMLLAESQGVAVALVASTGWHARSAGFMGTSDGWQDLARHRRMTWQYERAVNGSVALTGELALDPAAPEAILVLACGRIWTEAAMRARGALQEAFPALEEGAAAPWRDWMSRLPPFGGDNAERRMLARNSLMVLRAHECPAVPGALIASLGVSSAAPAIEEDYPPPGHLVSVRDVCVAGAALLAAGDPGPVREALSYLWSVQDADGTWPPNFWLDGIGAWHGLQLDQVARAVLLADLAVRRGALRPDERGWIWPMVRAAALALVRHHPLAGQDRWGERGGSKLYGLGLSCGALLVAAEWAEACGDAPLALLLADTADHVHLLLEEALAASPGADVDLVPLASLGLIALDDPRLLRGLDAVDATLSVELPAGRAWRRREGEAPRSVLVAERASLALARGDREEALALCRTLEGMAGEGGMLPERVDGPDGRGGAVMPFLWAHAEHVLLLRGLADGALFDAPPQIAARYAGGAVPPRVARWRADAPVVAVPRGLPLRIELPCAADLRWSADEWASAHDTRARTIAPGVFVAELPAADLSHSPSLVFTWRECDSGAWAGVDHRVTIVPAS